MPIDRRITNGLAWAGALIVVAVPAADFALRQFSPQDNPQVALIEALPEPEREPSAGPTLPTPAAERPATAAKPEPEATGQPEPQPEPEAAADPVTTANSASRVSGADAVDAFLQSGRALPSYISGTTTQDAPATTPPAVATVPAPAPVAAAPTANPPVAPAAPTSEASAPVAPTETTAALPRTRIVTFPTPVSERPAPVQRPAVAAQPPLIIDPSERVVTAADLEDWESGPLSEFLARRQGGGSQTGSEYDPNGFFLDQGPNSRNGAQRFPRAYEDDYYFPFE